MQTLEPPGCPFLPLSGLLQEYSPKRVSRRVSLGGSLGSRLPPRQVWASSLPCSQPTQMHWLPLSPQEEPLSHYCEGLEKGRCDLMLSSLRGDGTVIGRHHSASPALLHNLIIQLPHFTAEKVEAGVGTEGS